jgi:hypothetical protein
LTLRALATGESALSHHPFNALAPSYTVDHLRDLLMTAGSLPVRDRQILRFGCGPAICSPASRTQDDRRVVATYISWHLHRRLLALSDAGGLPPSSPGSPRQQARAAVAFLAWLRARRGCLAECHQAD